MGRTRVWICIIAILAARYLHAAGFDVSLPDADRAKLEQFAAHELVKADKSYSEGKYKQAAVEYESFILGFPKTPAIPYAKFQRARCMQFEDDALEAIRMYNELVDDFPTLVAYAAPALYFMADSHLQNRDIPNAVKVWTELVTDADYRKHPLAAVAINKLAPNLMEQEKPEEAMKLYRQGAVDFRTLNPDQAFQSLNALLDYYMLSAPNEPELRKLFKAVGGFERTPKTVEPNADVTQDRQYWQRIWERVSARAAQFTLIQADSKRKLLGYWAEAFKGRFPDWKEYQEQLAAFTQGATPPK